jgi:hypothetical protein
MMSNQEIIKSLEQKIKTTQEDEKEHLEYVAENIDGIQTEEGIEEVVEQGVETVDSWDLNEVDSVIWANGYVKGTEEAIRLLKLD